LRFNLPVFAMSVLVSLVSSFAFGLAPALQTSKVDVNEALREGGRGNVGSRHRVGDVFVAGEVALSLVLLVCAGLLLKSFSNLQRVGTGFRTERVLTLDFDMAESKYRDWGVRTQFVERFLAGVRALPGVESAGLTGGLPLTSKGGLREEFTPEGSPAWNETPASGVYRVITPGFFETLKVPLVRGRFFDSRDKEDAPLVAIINQKAAKGFWPNQDPIGKRLKLGSQSSNTPWLQVVGVTADTKQTALNDAPREEIYCPYLQSKESWEWVRFLVVRTSGDPLQVQGELRGLVEGIDPQEPLNHVMTLSEIVNHEMSQTAMQATLLSGLAGLALIMACVGIYGVMAYLVTQRTQEIGVRIALGAQSRSILSLVLGHGTKLTMAGITTGLLAAFLLTRLLSSLLFGVSPIDALTFVTVSTILTVVALLASYIPARRATKVDPIIALRHE